MRQAITRPEQPQQSSLTVGITVRTIHAGRVGTVTRVYADGSAGVRWHDKPSVAPDLAHERLPRSLLMAVDGCMACVDARALCIRALRAAATAPTYQDALDITGDALRRLAELAQRTAA